MRSALAMLAVACLLTCFSTSDLSASDVSLSSASKSDSKQELLGKSRTFLFTYAGTVKELAPGAQAEIWFPAPQTTLEQQVEIVSKKLAANASFFEEKQYGNKVLFLKAPADKSGTIPFEIIYRATRREVKTNATAHVTLSPRGPDNVSRFLQADRLVPVGGKPLELVKDKKVSETEPIAAAKTFYDVVNEHMKYSKEGKGWGNGDAVWACTSKFGNCTDFHSLFISMTRGRKIPSKFEMGFSLPPKRGGGPVTGYHCWAWFMPENKGWVPVDISEANRFPQMKEYYFGNLTEDRIQFSTGRDIDLEPRQKGPPLNYFIYPYVEVSGEPYPKEKIVQSFAYEDVQ